MKKILLLASLALASAAYAATPEPTALRVVPTVGEPFVIAFEQKPELSFTTTGVLVKGETIDGNGVSFDFDGIECIDFTNESGVEEATISDIMLKVTPSEIQISNLPDNSTVMLFSLDGRKIFSTNTSGVLNISRDRLAKGIYVLSINKNVFKISI